MLARYTMVRGAPASALPKGVRQDTRKHTRHVVRPTAELVDGILGSEDPRAWARFAKAYRALLAKRFAEEPAAFDALAELARSETVLLGCSCPSAANPDVARCHTTFALAFMKERYPDLDVQMP